jgi:hypothetical protein
MTHKINNAMKKNYETPQLKVHMHTLTLDVICSSVYEDQLPDGYFFDSELEF